jgi:hypothetical protein
VASKLWHAISTIPVGGGFVILPPTGRVEMNLAKGAARRSPRIKAAGSFARSFAYSKKGPSLQYGPDGPGGRLGTNPSRRLEPPVWSGWTASGPRVRG